VAVRITPMDIRQQQFTVRTFRGFDVREVDTFLEDLAGDYETLLKENALLKEQLQVLEDRTRGLEDRERVLQETLVTTHKVVEAMKEGARREAALVVKEAELNAEKVLEVARAQEAAIHAEVEALKRTRRQLIESLRSTIEMYRRLVDQDGTAAADDETVKA
jgi:cell division initiation protein